MDFQVFITQTGEDRRSVSVRQGTTLKELLEAEGYGDEESVTVNGIRTSDLTQEVQAEQSVFITRSHKAG